MALRVPSRLSHLLKRPRLRLERVRPSRFHVLDGVRSSRPVFRGGAIVADPHVIEPIWFSGHEDEKQRAGAPIRATPVAFHEVRRLRDCANCGGWIGCVASSSRP